MLCHSDIWHHCLNYHIVITNCHVLQSAGYFWSKCANCLDGSGQVRLMLSGSFFGFFFCLENPKTNLIEVLTSAPADFRNWCVDSRHSLSFAAYFTLPILMHQNLLLTRYNPEPLHLFFFSIVTIESAFSYLIQLIHSQMDMQVSD